MKYLSVCSGIEAATVAWHPLGWEPLAFSEIEPFPRAVLQHHYPNVPLYGDFTKLRDEPIIQDADILVGGTPCQAFSVAGLRKSLDDDRGNLTLEFVRLANAIDAIRLDAGKPPSIIVWENVPGVLSVKDNAFGCFLAALAGDTSPYVPPRNKWTNAGLVAGPQRTIAWRVLDAQYFGLAQRRRRVFVVASARNGFDPAKVLFESEGVRRDSPPRRETGEGTAIRTTSRTKERSQWDLVKTQIKQTTIGNLELFSPSISPCLETQVGGLRQPCTQAYVVMPPLTASMATPLGNGGKDDFIVAHTLQTQCGSATEDGTGRGAPLVPVAYPINTQIALRHNALGERTGMGIGEPQDPAFTLQAGHSHAVAFSHKDSSRHALGCGSSGGQASVAVAFGGDIARTLSARHDSSPCADRGQDVVATAMQVRRLTPVECERLQGFPDAYTMIPWKKKPAADCPDGPRYKALGNSMAVPVMRWIGKRVSAAT